MFCVRYIFHSCFVVESPSANFIFDYWKDPLEISDNGSNNSVRIKESRTSRDRHPFLDMLDRSKPLYILVSHHHKDHLNREIFQFTDSFDNVRYIISKEVQRSSRHHLNPESTFKGPKVDPAIVTVLRPGETFSDRLITVRAFASTDIGNSYLVEADGRTIFHAGDLNAWIWKDESTAEEVKKATDDFIKIAETIASATSVIDYCMFPVDARIGTDFFTGARLLTRMIDIRHFFPMHFELADDEKTKAYYHLKAADFRLYANPERGEYISLQSSGETFAQASHNPVTTKFAESTR